MAVVTQGRQKLDYTGCTFVSLKKADKVRFKFCTYDSKGVNTLMLFDDEIDINEEGNLVLKTYSGNPLAIMLRDNEIEDLEKM